MKRKVLEVQVEEFIHSIGMLIRRVRTAAVMHDVSLTENAVLGRIQKGGPATTAELARAEGMKPQSMGTTIAALEKSGLIERKPHPTDGRQVHLDLTAKGVALRKSTGEAKRTWVAKSVSKLSDKEQETLFEAGRIIRRICEGDPQ